MQTAELLARARARRLVPNRLARPVFWRLAIRRPDVLSLVEVESVVRFGERQLKLQLALESRQNWAMLFQGFKSGPEGQMIREFSTRAAVAGCVIDVGVNHGLYLYHALGHCPPGATIVGMEANPSLVESVNANLRLNGVAELVRLAAATDEDGPVRLHVGRDDMVSSLRHDHVSRYGGAASEITVPGVSLDSLVHEGNLRPNLIKIDVEGHEAAVLAGARRTLAQYHPALVIEVTPETFAEVDEVLRSLFYCGRLFTREGLRNPSRAIIDSHGYSNLIYEHRA